MFVSPYTELDNVSILSNETEVVSNLMRSRNSVDDNITLVGFLRHRFWVG